MRLTGVNGVVASYSILIFIECFGEASADGFVAEYHINKQGVKHYKLESKV